VSAFFANQQQIQGPAQNFSASFQTLVNLETKSIRNMVAGEYNIADVSMDHKMHHIALSTVGGSEN
jgi:hypothetical protein